MSPAIRALAEAPAAIPVKAGRRTGLDAAAGTVVHSPMRVFLHSFLIALLAPLLLVPAGCASDSKASGGPVEARGAEAKRADEADVSDKIKSAKASSHTFSQRRLLEIIEEQEKFFKWLGENPDKTSPEAHTRIRKLGGLWNSYFADNPDDVDALILYGKFRRAMGNPSEAYKIFKKIDSMDGDIPVVKQQLATFEGESGSYKDAYSHLKLAVELDPKQAVYHSQMGQLLFLFRDKFIASGMFDRDTVDKMYLESMRNAYKLAPECEEYKWRYAQSFYDVSKADWNEPLKVWDELLADATLDLERQTINANRARVLIELYRDAEAEEILNGINHPSLAGAKRAMLDIIRRDAASARGSESKILKQIGSESGEKAPARAPVAGAVSAGPVGQSVPHVSKKEYSH